MSDFTKGFLVALGVAAALVLVSLALGVFRG